MRGLAAGAMGPVDIKVIQGDGRTQGPGARSQKVGGWPGGAAGASGAVVRAE